MAIRSSQFFTFNSTDSTTFGIWNVNLSAGMMEEPFMATRHLNEVKIRGKDKPYFSGVTNDPLTFTLSFAFNNSWTGDDIRAVSRWLFTDYYKPLQFSDNTDRTYYAIIEGDSKLIHNGAGQGYINLNVRCDSPYSYSPVNVTSIYDLSTNPVGGTTIQFNNLGDISILPEVYITMVGDGDAEIINLSNGGASFKYTSAIANPTVAPVMTQVANSGSTLPAATYYGRYSYSGTLGETMVSPETSFVLAAGNNLVMTIPALPSNATISNFYIGTVAGSGTKQGTSITTSYSRSTALVAGATSPTVNTSTLKNGETVYTDCENEVIISDLAQTTYRYANLSGNFLELIYGNNSLQIKGNLKLKFRYSFTYLQG